MTQHNDFAQKTSNKTLVKEVADLLEKQQKEINKQRRELESRTDESNQLAAANATRLLKAAYVQKFVDKQKSKRSLSFSKTIGNDVSIEKNEDHLFAKRHTLVHFKSNSVCTWIPKVGCTNMRYSIPLANGAISTPEDIDWVHNNNDSFQGSNQELLNANYAFVVLRNPYKRLLSFYLDKLCHNDPNQSDKSYSHAQNKFNTNESTSFKDFVRILWRDPELINADIHVKRQTDFLVYNQYDDYFCLEDYKNAVSKVFDTTGLEVIDTRGMGSGNTTHKHQESADIDYTWKASEIGRLLQIGHKPNIKNMYSDEMCKLVGSLFLTDIMLYLEKIKGSEKEMNYWISRSIQE